MNQEERKKAFLRSERDKWPRKQFLPICPSSTESKNSGHYFTKDNICNRCKKSYEELISDR